MVSERPMRKVPRRRKALAVAVFMVVFGGGLYLSLKVVGPREPALRVAPKAPAEPEGVPSPGAAHTEHGSRGEAGRGGSSLEDSTPALSTPTKPAPHNAAAAASITEVVGKSVQGQPITLTRIGEGPDVTVVFGGFHGDEPQSTAVVGKLRDYLSNHREALSGATVVLVPCVNPDGMKKGTRQDANGVDINRNFPTSDWGAKPRKRRFAPGEQPGSEPETRAVMRVIEKFTPSKIISVHGPMHMVNYDGPAEGLAQAMAKRNGYQVSRTVGYVTPGSFGTYAGKGRHIPTITLELPNKGAGECWEENRAALLEAIQFPRVGPQADCNAPGQDRIPMAERSLRASDIFAIAQTMLPNNMTQNSDPGHILSRPFSLFHLCVQQASDHPHQSTCYRS
jgi:protein MpaA